MRLRVGILDITVLLVVLVVLLLPDRDWDVAPAYDPAEAAAIEVDQARLTAHPDDGAAAEALAEKLVKVGQTDWALRAAGEATRYDDSPGHWRALLAVSSVHAERIEIPRALEWGQKALRACNGATGDACPPYERIRLEMYVRELEAGIEIMRSGVDPAADPHEFRKAIDTAYPRARLKRD